MAPLYMACRPRLLRLLLIIVFILFVIHDVPSLFVYERLTLLKIRDTVNNLPDYVLNGHSKTPPPLLASVPAYLWRPICVLPRKKRHRRRGKRGGVLVKLRTYLASSCADVSGCSLNGGPTDCVELGLRRSLEVSYRWLRPAGPGAGCLYLRCRPVRLQVRGCVRGNLRPLKHATLQSVSCRSVRAALLNTRSLTNKTFILNDLISTHDLDFLMLTETWLKPGDNSAFSELLPPGYSFLSTPRVTSRGGGLASVFKQHLSCRLLPSKNYSSFELQLFLAQFACPLLCAVVYRPPKFNKDFIPEFSELLAELRTQYDSLLICGDFNIHVCCPSSQLANDFQSLLSSLDLTQSVNAPTHQHGHTLDLIISHGLTVSISEISDICISDHLPVMFKFKGPVPAAKSLTPAARRRTITSTTAGEFAAAFMNTTLYSQDVLASPLCPEDFISSFNSSCSEILNIIAPFRRRSVRIKRDPWLNDTTRALRRRCRQAERKWKKDKLHVSLGILRDSLTEYQNAVKVAKCQFLSNVISTSSNRPRALFSTIQSVINPPNNALQQVSKSTCNDFLHYFVDKVASVRQSIKNTSNSFDLCSSTVRSVLNVFEPVSLSFLSEVVQGLRPTNCPLDVIPSKVFKQVFSTVGPCLLSFINGCLSLGSVPTVLKHAVVRPLLKKSNLDPAVLSNFRPVSHLPFISKVLEKIVFTQLHSFLENNQIFEKFQSGFRTRHSTESALLKVQNDILLSLDVKKPVLLVMLDLSAAFDTVDHSVLLTRLAQQVGLQGPVLQWFRSYLTDRSFSVRFGDLSSSSAPLTSGVPQGSILGPILFSLYMLPLGTVISKHNMSFHLYADDLQIYLPVVPSCPSSLESISRCLDDIKVWLSQNFLCLNEEKTECILFGTSNLPSVSAPGPVALAHNFSHVVKNLGVKLDNSLKFDKQISSVVSASFFQLRLLSKAKPFLSRADLEKAIHAFVSSRVDYCNALYVGVNQTGLHRLQLVQNAAARLLTNSRKRDHITPVLYSLHWLPVQFRIHFKILMFVFNAVSGRAPSYLCELLTPHQPRRALRSAGQHLLEVPRSRCKQWGDRSFAVVGPKLWNSLPIELRSITDLPLFKSKLKTHLFKMAFGT